MCRSQCKACCCFLTSRIECALRFESYQWSCTCCTTEDSVLLCWTECHVLLLHTNCGRPLNFNYLHPAWLTFNYICILGDMYTTQDILEDMYITQGVYCPGWLNTTEYNCYQNPLTFLPPELQLQLHPVLVLTSVTPFEPHFWSHLLTLCSIKPLQHFYQLLRARHSKINQSSLKQHVPAGNSGNICC